MKQHNGMRPQDIVILLKIVAKSDENWYMKDIANELSISASEVSESINRSKISGLIDSSGKRVRSQAFLEFIIHGLKYVFPQRPGHRTRGIPTAHSAPPLNKTIRQSDTYVWPTPEGDSSGFAIEPLYRTVTTAIESDQRFYQLMALVDAVRVGRAREIALAEKELRRLIK